MLLKKCDEATQSIDVPSLESIDSEVRMYFQQQNDDWSPTLSDSDETNELVSNCLFNRGSFTNHVDKIFTIFDHPPTSCGQAWTFYLPPTYVHVDIFVPTPFYQLNMYFKI